MTEHVVSEYRFSLRGSLIFMAVAGLAIAMISQGTASVFGFGVIVGIGLIGWASGFVVTGTVPGAVQGATIFIYTFFVFTAALWNNLPR